MTPAVVGDLPLIIVAIDGIAGFLDDLGADPGTSSGDLIERLGRDGPSVGMAFVIGAERPNDVPRPLRGQLRARLALELADPNDYLALGLSSRNLPTFVAGRGLLGSEQMVCHVVRRLEVPTIEDDAVPPPVVEVVPAVIERGRLSAASIDGDLSVPVGVAVDSHNEVSLHISPGDHVTIAGPSASGRTTALRLIAEQVREASPDVVIVGVVPATSAARGLLDAAVLDAGGTIDEIAHVLRMALDDDRRWLVLVDDADRLAVEDGPLVELAKSALPNVTVVAALRSSVGRGLFGHWTRHVRASGLGILLMPDNTVDGELLGIRLPRDEHVERSAGRGYVVGPSGVVPTQLARVGKPLNKSVQ